MKPTVGLDARMVWSSGIGTYLRELLGAWSTTPDLPYNLHLLTKRNADTGARPHFFTFPSTPITASIYSLQEQWQVPSAFRSITPSLLHIPHYNVPVALASRALVTVHDLIHLLFPDFLPSRAAYLYAQVMFHMVIPRCRAIVTISEHSRRDLLQRLKLPEKKITVIPLGTPEDMLQPIDPQTAAAIRERHGLHAPYFLYVGNLRPIKNVPWLIKCFDRFAERTPGCPPLVLVGRNDMKDSRMTSAPSRHVRWLGEVPRTDLKAIYAGAMAFLFPSLYEGFGLPPLEAMACGTPVIASNRASLPEVVGSAGILLDPHDEAGWTAALETMLSNSGRIEAMREAGRERAKQLRWTQTAAKTQAVYEAML